MNTTISIEGNPATWMAIVLAMLAIRPLCEWIRYRATRGDALRRNRLRTLVAKRKRVCTHMKLYRSSHRGIWYLQDTKVDESCNYCEKAWSQSDHFGLDFVVRHSRKEIRSWGGQTKLSSLKRSRIFNYMLIAYLMWSSMRVRWISYRIDRLTE